jgi:predicted glutamine amidotransferase
MCLIALSPKGALIPFEIMRHSNNTNGDGIGVMSADGIRKFMGKKKLKHARKYVERTLVPAGIPYAMHWRWATHGAVHIDNTHPYLAPTGKHWVMHNGVISLTTQESTKEESDTAVFVRKYMHDAAPLDDDKYYKIIENLIGWSNKLVVMDDEGKFRIVNDDAGVWIEGMWYSNTYSLPESAKPKRPFYGNQYTHTSAYEGSYRVMDKSQARGYPGSKMIDGINVFGRWLDGEFYAYEDQKAAAKLAVRWDHEDRCWKNGDGEECDWEGHPKAGKEVSYPSEGSKSPASASPGGASPGSILHRLPYTPSPRTSSVTGGGAIWNPEDRQAYYDSLERDLTPTEAAAYMDQGADMGRQQEPIEPGELAALRTAQGAILAAAYPNNNKAESPVGGDFVDPDGYTEVDLGPPEDDDEEQNGFKRYLRQIARNVYL